VKSPRSPRTPPNPRRLRAALAARGWEAQPAWFAATGIQALVVLIEAITEAEREALVHWGAKSGADVLTGDGWALVAAAASRLAPLARYDRAPPALARLAPELGRFLAAHAEPPASGRSAAPSCPSINRSSSGSSTSRRIRSLTGGASRRQTRPSPTLNG